MECSKHVVSVKNAERYTGVYKVPYLISSCGGEYQYQVERRKKEGQGREKKIGNRKGVGKGKGLSPVHNIKNQKRAEQYTPLYSTGLR